MPAYTGELAALGTSICWSFTSVMFTLSGRQVGSPVVNRTRLLLAVILVSGVHLLTQGEVWPVHSAPSRWMWMGLSGVVGFVIGDAFLFQAFVMIGPRLSMLMMALAPVLSVGMAWVLLGESLSAVELLGIFVTVGGIAWVVTDRAKTAADDTEHNATAALLSDRHSVRPGRRAGTGGRLYPLEKGLRRGFSSAVRQHDPADRIHAAHLADRCWRAAGAAQFQSAA